MNFHTVLFILFLIGAATGVTALCISVAFYVIGRQEAKHGRLAELDHAERNRQWADAEDYATW